MFLFYYTCQCTIDVTCITNIYFNTDDTYNILIVSSKSVKQTRSVLLFTDTLSSMFRTTHCLYFLIDSVSQHFSSANCIVLVLLYMLICTRCYIHKQYSC